MFGLGLGAIPYLLGGSALLLILVGGVEEFRINSFRSEAAVAKQHEAEYAGQAAKVNEIFAREEASREKARADQERANSDELLRLRNERDAIETRFKNVSADRAKVAAENIRFRNNAPKTDSRLVGPTMVHVLNCLRQQQQAFRAGRAAAPCGGG